MLGFLANVQVNEAIGTTCKINGQLVSLGGSPFQFFNQLKGVLFTLVFAGSRDIYHPEDHQPLWPAARQRGGRDSGAGSEPTWRKRLQ